MFAQSLILTKMGDKAAPLIDASSESTWQQAGAQRLLANNRAWASDMVASDPTFFDRLAHQQSPEYFWIGCADSRVPANQIVDLQPGEVFVQRNVGNQVHHSDLNCMACLEYAVNALHVKHIVVSGHYNCGAVRAALIMPQKTEGVPKQRVVVFWRCTKQRFVVVFWLCTKQSVAVFWLCTPTTQHWSIIGSRAFATCATSIWRRWRQKKRTSGVIICAS